MQLLDRRVRAETRLEIRAARAEARRQERAANEADADRRRLAKAERRRLLRAMRASQRADYYKRFAAATRRLRPAAPVALVTAFAMYGQIAYGYQEYSAPGTPWSLRVVIAVGAAIAVESIANYVQWHAHDALLHKATSSATRLRIASYLIALVVAGVNYSHFAGEGMAPTPGAVVFGMFSASQPWLWGLHTRRAQRIQLLREGRADSCGAVFSAERWRAFPLRTFHARRWSIDHGVTDPQRAWNGYKAAVAARKGQPTTEQGIALLVALAQLAAATTMPAAPAQSDALSPTDKSDLERMWNSPAASVNTTPVKPTRSRTQPAALTAVDHDKAARLIAEGKGRAVLKRELGCSEHTAKQLVKHYRNNGHSQETTS